MLFRSYPIDQFTKPHKIVCEYLEQQNIKFEVEKYINPYFVDIFIEPNKIIEVYGDYWHGNPKFYKKDKLITYFDQEILIEKIWQKDERRIKYLKDENNQVLIIWEDDINNNLELIKEKIINFLH